MATKRPYAVIRFVKNNSYLSVDVESKPPAVRSRFWMLRRLLWMTFAIGVLAVAILLVMTIRKAQRAAIASASKGPLNQLQLALRNYHDFHGRFPPAFIADENGTPMHSWRVQILPFIEEREALKALTTIAGREPVTRSKLISQGYLQ